jgi:hypothetical protein
MAITKATWLGQDATVAGISMLIIPLTRPTLSTGTR